MHTDIHTDFFITFTSTLKLKQSNPPLVVIIIKSPHCQYNIRADLMYHFKLHTFTKYRNTL